MFNKNTLLKSAVTMVAAVVSVTGVQVAFSLYQSQRQGTGLKRS